MIRQATLEDLESVCSIEQQFGVEAFSKRSLRRFIMNGQATVICENEILGYGIVMFRRNSLKARLYSIAIAKEHHGKKLGYSLLEALETLAIEKGMTTMLLEVAVSNLPALSLYRSRGYQQSAILDNYYNDGGSAIKMKKVIAK